MPAATSESDDEELLMGEDPKQQEKTQELEEIARQKEAAQIFRAKLANEKLLMEKRRFAIITIDNGPPLTRWWHLPKFVYCVSQEKILKMHSSEYLSARERTERREAFLTKLEKDVALLNIALSERYTSIRYRYTFVQLLFFLTISVMGYFVFIRYLAMDIFLDIEGERVIISNITQACVDDSEWRSATWKFGRGVCSVDDPAGTMCSCLNFREHCTESTVNCVPCVKLAESFQQCPRNCGRCSVVDRLGAVFDFVVVPVLMAAALCTCGICCCVSTGARKKQVKSEVYLMCKRLCVHLSDAYEPIFGVTWKAERCNKKGQKLLRQYDDKSMSHVEVAANYFIEVVLLLDKTDVEVDTDSGVSVRRMTRVGSLQASAKSSSQLEQATENPLVRSDLRLDEENQLVDVQRPRVYTKTDLSSQQIGQLTRQLELPSQDVWHEAAEARQRAQTGGSFPSHHRRQQEGHEDTRRQRTQRHGHERGSDSLAHHRSAHATPTYHRERSAYDEHEHAHGHHHSAMQLSRPRETTVRFSDDDDGMEIYALGRNRSAIPYDGRGSGSTTRHQAPAMGGRSHASAMRMGDNDDGTLRRYRSAMPLMSRGGGYQQVRTSE